MVKQNIVIGVLGILYQNLASILGLFCSFMVWFSSKFFRKARQSDSLEYMPLIWAKGWRSLKCSFMRKYFQSSDLELPIMSCQLYYLGCTDTINCVLNRIGVNGHQIATLFFPEQNHVPYLHTNPIKILNVHITAATAQLTPQPVWEFVIAFRSVRDDTWHHCLPQRMLFRGDTICREN